MSVFNVIFQVIPFGIILSSFECWTLLNQEMFIPWFQGLLYKDSRYNWSDWDWWCEIKQNGLDGSDKMTILVIYLDHFRTFLLFACLKYEQVLPFSRYNRKDLLCLGIIIDLGATNTLKFSTLSSIPIIFRILIFQQLL